MQFHPRCLPVFKHINVEKYPIDYYRDDLYVYIVTNDFIPGEHDKVKVLFVQILTKQEYHVYYHSYRLDNRQVNFVNKDHDNLDKMYSVYTRTKKCKRCYEIQKKIYFYLVKHDYISLSEFVHRIKHLNPIFLRRLIVRKRKNLVMIGRYRYPELIRNYKMLVQLEFEQLIKYDRKTRVRLINAIFDSEGYHYSGVCISKIGIRIIIEYL